MLPRNSADWRSILWALLMPTVLVAQYANPALVPYLWPLSFYFAMAAGTMAHNHNHTPVFSSKKANAFYALWISLFYGYPSFAWIPTHNLNHHRHVNRAGDATITWRHTNRNTWYVAVSYFFVSAYYQSTPIKEYIRKAKANNRPLYRQIVVQYAVWIAFLVTALAVALVWRGFLPYGFTAAGFWAGFKLFALTVGLPTVFGPWTMMWFNYMQHVHADPWSKYNHSRNITGRVFNFLVFNNGLHTVHHDNAGAHWSNAYEAHGKIADKIDPRLNEWSFWWWIVRGYVIPAFVPGPLLETKQIGRAPFDAPTKQAARKMEDIDSVEALEAGNNSAIAEVA